MLSFITAIILLALALLGVVVRKTYFFVPIRELKRQAKDKGSLASQLYPAVAYGDSLRGLLIGWIMVTSTIGFVLLCRTAPIWLSLLLVLGVLYAAFTWLPASRVTGFGARLTALVTPAILWILGYAYPALRKATGVFRDRFSLPPHTGLYERADLLAIIDQQQAQTDNRVSSEELEIARRALSFDDQVVGDILLPRKQVKTVLATETVGPVFIDEIYKSDQEYTLVRESPKGAFVGILERQDLGLNSSGHVSDIMRPQVYYVHEQDTLSSALQAFYTTNYPLFVVINSFEEFIGVITVEHMLKQLLGHIPGDDFKEYSDPAAVAGRHLAAAEKQAGATSEEVLE